jgi:hypothetical protein
MEQYDKVFEYSMLGEIFDFQAPNEKVAERYQEIATEHFKQRLGDKFAQNLLEGPKLASSCKSVESAA